MSVIWVVEPTDTNPNIVSQAVTLLKREVVCDKDPDKLDELWVDATGFKKRCHVRK